jgi:hypothetical protein
LPRSPTWCTEGGRSDGNGSRRPSFKPRTRYARAQALCDPPARSVRDGGRLLWKLACELKARPLALRPTTPSGSWRTQASSPPTVGTSTRSASTACSAGSRRPSQRLLHDLGPPPGGRPDAVRGRATSGERAGDEGCRRATGRRHCSPREPHFPFNRDYEPRDSHQSPGSGMLRP